MTSAPSLLSIRELEKSYSVRKSWGSRQNLLALRGINLNLESNQTLAVVGESGCGKSTLAKAILRLEEPTSGEIFIQGKAVDAIPRREYCSMVQMVFQDPHSSLNPRKKLFDLIAEPLRVRSETRAKIEQTVKDIASKVGLREEFLERYPHMLSGGQKQRVGIARALVTRPQIIVCDEPVSALDVSVQAQVLNLLLDLQSEFQLSYIFISHDLNVVRFIAHRVAVLYLGRVVELGDREQIFGSALHPYTRLLLASAPGIKMNLPSDQRSLGGADEKNEIVDLPSPLNPPSGCSFHSRCPWVTDRCRTEIPELREVQKQMVACHHAGDFVS